MTIGDYDLEKALQIVKGARGYIHPNPGFLNQLRKYYTNDVRKVKWRKLSDLVQSIFASTELVSFDPSLSELFFRSRWKFRPDFFEYLLATIRTCVHSWARLLVDVTEMRFDRLIATSLFFVFRRKEHLKKDTEVPCRPKMICSCVMKMNVPTNEWFTLICRRQQTATMELIWPISKARRVYFLTVWRLLCFFGEEFSCTWTFLCVCFSSFPSDWQHWTDTFDTSKSTCKSEEIIETTESTKIEMSRSERRSFRSNIVDKNLRDVLDAKYFLFFFFFSAFVFIVTLCQ